MLSRIPTVAPVALAAAMSLSPATANASTEDQRLLDTVGNLEIQFGAIISGLQSKGLDGAQAANFMWAATDIYCPQYNDVVGD